MRTIISVLCLCAFVPLNALAAATVFINVNVIAMTDDRVVRAQTVVINNGRITAIGDVDVTSLPEDADVVDGTDRYLLPGLTEMHGHITATDWRSLDSVFGLFVANGVTTVRGMLGRPDHLELRQKVLDQEILGPRLITSGPSLNGNSIEGVEHAAATVEEHHRAGYDFLKIHPGLTYAEFMAIAETANKLDMPFAGHVPSDVGVPEALAAGIATIDHLDGYMQTLISPDEAPSGGLGGFFGLLLAVHADESRIQGIAEATAAAGVAIVPTEALFEHSTNDVDPDEMGDWPEMKYVSRRVVREWIAIKRDLAADDDTGERVGARAIDLRRKLILALHQAGVQILLGSDSPQRFNVPGFALHRELEYLVAAGLTEFEALQTGTVNAARFFGNDDLGTIEVGKIADLVLLDQNPLADIINIRRVHGTMLRGRWVSREEIDAILARVARN